MLFRSKKWKGNDKCLVEQAQVPCTRPPHNQPLDGADHSDNDTGMLNKWDPFAGLKPSALDDRGLDADVKMEADLPYKAESEVSSVMVDMMIGLDDCDARDIDWLPLREQRKLAARKQV